MAEIFGLETGFDMPDLTAGFQINWMYVAVIFMFLITLGIILYVLYMNKQFNKKIIVFENISGQGYQPILKDRARLISIGDGGEELLFLRKKKVYRTAYGRKMGKNTYWFCIGQDGYWYNIVLGDLDAKMGMLDIEPIDRDMRYMHVAVRKNISDRYKKVKFMEKYGTIVLSAAFLIIMIFGIWFLLDKMSETAGTINVGIESAKQVMDQARQSIASLDNVVNSGSGVVASG